MKLNYKHFVLLVSYVIAAPTDSSTSQDFVVSIDVDIAPDIEDPFYETVIFNVPPGLMARDIANGGSPQYYYEAELNNKVITYNANIGVGTPAQNFLVTVDTGSSDFWVSATKEMGDPFFEPTKSSTFKSNNTEFKMTYLKGSNSGTWGTDVISFGNAKVKEMPFGYVTHGQQLGGVMGVLGIGAMQNEANVVQKNMPAYPNFPRKLKDEGLIKKTAFSLYLDDLNATSGKLLFGGVDKSKFKGDHLYTVPIVSERSLDVELSGISVKGKQITSWEPQAITVDSGATFSYLPPEVIVEIGDSVKGADFVSGLYLLDSTKVDWNQTIDFIFSGAMIKVPIKLFALRTKDIIKPTTKIDPKYEYALGMISNFNSRGVNLLGDTFLRAAYVVYDIEDWKIAIAESDPGKGTKQNIQAIINEIPFGTAAPKITRKK